MDPNKKRLQFDFSQEAIDEIDELQNVLGLASRAEVIRLAISLLRFGSEERKRGGRLLVDDGQNPPREVFVPHRQKADSAPRRLGAPPAARKKTGPKADTPREELAAGHG